MDQDINKIEVKNLHKAFGRKKVLDGVDVSIKKGESLVVIGGSGTGKSVLIKCIQGLITPDSGSIKIDGVETVGVPRQDNEKLYSTMGMLFQGGALFDSLTVWENVAFGLLENQKMPRRQAREKAIEVLRQGGRAQRRRCRFGTVRAFGRHAKTGRFGASGSHPAGNHLF